MDKKIEDKYIVDILIYRYMDVKIQRQKKIYE